MPVIDLASPTQLLWQWGWLLLTRANGIVYLLIIAVLVLGMTVRLPRAKRDIAAVEAQRANVTGASDESDRP